MSEKRKLTRVRLELGLPLIDQIIALLEGEDAEEWRQMKIQMVRVIEELKGREKS